MMAMRNQRGQTTTEYALLAAVVIGALLVMQIYMKRGFSGRLREATDQVGEQFTPFTATYSLNKGLTQTRLDTTTAPGAVTSNVTAESRTRTGTEEPVQTSMEDETLFFQE